MKVIFVFLAAYVLGSIPFGLIISRLWVKVDIRQHGSGNIGMTNVLRTVGYVPALFTLLFDSGKGVLAVLLAQLVTDDPFLWFACGTMAVVGHNWSVFLRFKGGRGVATTAGVLLATQPAITGILFIIWVLVVVLTKYVSLASITVAVVFPICLLLFKVSLPELLLGTVVAAFTVFRHRPNIQRLLQGTEYKFGEKSRPQ